VALGFIDPTQYSITFANPNPQLGFKSSSYGRLLPDFDFKLKLGENGMLRHTDSLLFRFAASQTLSQPLQSNIAPFADIQHSETKPVGCDWRQH